MKDFVKEEVIGIGYRVDKGGKGEILIFGFRERSGFISRNFFLVNGNFFLRYWEFLVFLNRNYSGLRRDFYFF